MRGDINKNILHYETNHERYHLAMTQQQIDVDTKRRQLERDTATASSFCERVPVTSSLDKLEKELKSAQTRSAEMSRV